MTQYCLDCCSLINLYCGWGGIQELHRLGQGWAISQAAFNEFTHVRTQTPDGSLIQTPINHADVLGQYILTVLPITTATENDTLIALSAELDDGEAASLTLAKHRDMTFVTDDKLAVRAAQTLSVPTVSTLQILMAWETLDPLHSSLMATTIDRIAVLASFAPPRGDQNRAWWYAHRSP
jgi:predicted nucleic acid-binding protein